MKSFLVYKLTCDICISSYIVETCGHFKTKIDEHIKKGNKLHVFKDMPSNTACFDLYNSFEVIDKANSKFDFHMKQALHIN